MIRKEKSILVCIVSQDNLNNKGFGQDLPSVENEVEEHNIFHSEVEALAPHISGDRDKVHIEIAKTEEKTRWALCTNEKTRVLKHRNNFWNAVL